MKPLANPSLMLCGIDLGTTHSTLAYAPSSDPQAPVLVFEVEQAVSGTQRASSDSLPSCLYAPLEEERSKSQDWVVGKWAQSRIPELPGRCISSAKSWLSHARVDRHSQILPWGADGSTPQLSPVEASSRILRVFRDCWNERFPDAPLEKQMVILTVPASFDQVARRLTLEAAHTAGLTVRLLEEPQAAFYDYWANPDCPLHDSINEQATQILVCDIGGGTSDFTLIEASRSSDGSLLLHRSAVGKHLLLGGDNMDLALAHLLESQLSTDGKRLDPTAFASLQQSCRAAKERLLQTDGPDDIPIQIAARSSRLTGSIKTATLTRQQVHDLVLNGFFPFVTRDAAPRPTRAGLTGFGLPYERDPAITQHIARFLQTHKQSTNPDLLLGCGGVFGSSQIAERLTACLSQWSDKTQAFDYVPDTRHSVARGAVFFARALLGHGVRIGGGSPRGYYVGVDDKHRQAVCLLPRGATEGEEHTAMLPGLRLVLGRAARFDLYTSETELHAPGAVVDIDGEKYSQLPPVTTRFDSTDKQQSELPVALGGLLSEVGTLELAAVELRQRVASGKRFSLEFELRTTSDAPADAASDKNAHSPPRPPQLSVGRAGQRLYQATELIRDAFDDARSPTPRRAKDLMRGLEKLLGERRVWTTELCRALYDELLNYPNERAFWMLAGYSLRPGVGFPGDSKRIARLVPLFGPGPHFGETRNWQQFWIAWRRVCAGLGEKMQVQIRNSIDPFLAPAEAKLKRRKGFKPQAKEEMLFLASTLENVPVAQRSQLGEWLLEDTWTNRDPRLWSAIGRLGARLPAYGSAHYVLPTRLAEEWLKHALQEKWDEASTAQAAAVSLGRRTGDRSRDVSDSARTELLTRLEGAGADPEQIRRINEVVEPEASDRAAFLGEELPAGLQWSGSE